MHNAPMTTSYAPALARFTSSLARVLFVDLDHPGAVRPGTNELRLLETVCEFVRAADRGQLHAACAQIDRDVIPALTGESVLALAATIEANAPWMLENIPRLQIAKQRLLRASDMADSFSGENLRKLAKAIEQEGARQ